MKDFYGLERYPLESTGMCILVALAKLLANALTVQPGFRVNKKRELRKRRFIRPAHWSEEYVPFTQGDPRLTPGGLEVYGGKYNPTRRNML